MAAGLIAGIASGIIGAVAQRRQQARSEAFERQRIQMTVADANAAGIHPLAALGAGIQYQNPFTGEAPGAGAAERVAEAVGSSSVAKLQERIANSEIMRNQAEASALLAEARATTLQAGQREAVVGAAAGATFIGAAPGASTNPTPDGSPENPWPSFGWWRMSDGSLVMGPNPNYAMDPTEIAYPALIGAADPFYYGGATQTAARAEAQAREEQDQLREDERSREILEDQRTTMEWQRQVTGADTQGIISPSVAYLLGLPTEGVPLGTRRVVRGLTFEYTMYGWEYLGGL